VKPEAQEKFFENLKRDSDRFTTMTEDDAVASMPKFHPETVSNMIQKMNTLNIVLREAYNGDSPQDLLS